MTRVLCVSLLALAAGCERQTKLCTLIGCTSGFQVEFRPADLVWRQGRYRVDVTADGATGSCEVTLPLSPCGTPSSTCTGQRTWSLGESGCALPADRHAISGVTFSGTTPARVDVTVHRDGRQIAANSFTPTYTTSRPNGPDCDPVCTQAPPATLELAP